MSDFPVQDGQLFLFQGDSITDCGRRGAAAPLGQGYPGLFVELATAAYPDRAVSYLNKGISGDTTRGLKERWDDDVIRHQPDWVSVLIGINDLHLFLFHPEDLKISAEQYRENYDWFLARTRAETDAQLVLLDPFYISRATGDTNRARVLEIIPDYIAAVHEMAERHGARLIKLHDLFQRQLQYRDPETFCPEPVHPSRSGHVLMALELARTLGAF